MSKNSESQFYINRHAIGWASGGGGQSTFYRGNNTVFMNGDNTFILDKKIFTFIGYKKSIFTPELIIFSMFSFFALFFNILVNSFSGIPLAPKIICFVMFVATFTPVIVSLLRSPKRITFKLSHSDFVTLYFISRQERGRLLVYLEKLNPLVKYNSAGYIVDVSFNMYDAVNQKSESGAMVKIENDQIKITTNSGRNIFTDYYSKSHDLLWQLYPFASIFVLMPIVLIVSSLLNNNFESGMLFSLIFLVAGILVMFVPTIISRGHLLLLNKDGYLSLRFGEPKERKKFEKEIKIIKSYKNKENSNYLSKERLKEYKIFNTSKYKFPTGLVIATIIFVLIISAVITTLDIFVILMITYFSIIFYSFFYIFYKDLMRENYCIYLRKKRFKEADLINGKINNYIVKDFYTGKRYFYNVELTVEYSQNGEWKSHVFSKDLLRGYPDFKIGQTVMLAISDKTISLLINKAVNYSYIPSQEIKANQYKEENIIKLKKHSNKVVDTNSSYKVLGQYKINIFAHSLGVIILLGLTSLFMYMVIATKDSVTRVVGSVFLLLFSSILLLAILSFIKIILRLKQAKLTVKNGVIKNAYILYCHTIIQKVQRSDSQRITYTYYLNIIYYNDNMQLKTDYLCEVFHTNFTGYGLPSISEKSFIDICTYNDKYVVLNSFKEKKK